MATELSVINTSLSHLGEEKQLTALRGPTPPREERVALGLLPDLVDAVLRRHPWLCAEVRLTLPREPLDGPADWKFKNVFVLPNDFLRLWSVDLPWTQDPYQVGPYTRYSADGEVVQRRKAVFTDHDGPLPVAFIARIDFEHMDAGLVDVLGFELASRMAGPLQADKAMARQVKDSAREAMALAVTAETSEFGEDPVNAGGRFLASR